MPEKLNKKATASRSGNRAGSRKNKQRPGCKAGNRPQASAPRIIANSFFALTAKPKPAIAVSSFLNDKRARIDDSEDGYAKMYADVLKCTQRAILLATGEKTTFDPMNNGYDLSESFELVLRMLKTNVIPAGWEYNIEKSHKTEEYHIVIYRACDFQAFWHVFEIAATVHSLFINHKQLHDMFILFLKNFIHYTKIEPWWGCALGYVIWDEESLRDRFENMEFDTEEERIGYEMKMEYTIDSYKKGETDRYQKLICSQKVMPVGQLRYELSKFSKRIDLVKWMLSACDLMEQKLNLNEFVYPELVEELGEGIMFDLQIVLLWDADDVYSQEQNEYLEAESQGCGIMDPIYHFRLTKDLKSFDKTIFDKAIKYPGQFTELYHGYNKAIKKYERKN